jgi:hypothetical protein
MFFVHDPFGNRVVLYEKTWLIHTAPKHCPEYGEVLPDLGDVRESVLKPDQIRRSKDPVIGSQSCIFEKFIGAENHLLRTPVYYDLEPETTYEAGISSGKVATSFYPDPPYQSRNVGEIFWVKPTADGEEEK